MKMHRPFVYIAAFFGAGILVSRFVPVPFGLAGVITVVFFVSGLTLSHRRVPATWLLLCAVAGLGIISPQSREYIPENGIEHVAKYYRRQPIVVEGVIGSDVQPRDAVNGRKTVFTLKVERVLAKWGWQKRDGKVLVNVYGDASVCYGDHIRVEGKIHRPYNFSAEKNFSYREYLSRKGIRFILSVKKSAPIKVIAHDKGSAVKAVSLRMRSRLKKIITDHLSENEAGIINAILLGDRSSVPKTIRALFVQTGTAHILAISGLHMGIVTALFLATARLMPAGRRIHLAVVIIMITAYTFMTGGRPSVVRAAVMAVVFLLSFIIEKEFDMQNALCFAALGLLLINPLNLFDAGFQLSFCCVFAIIHADSFMKRIGVRGDGKEGEFPGRKWFYRSLQSMVISAAIWISVAGLIAYYFNIVTPVTVLANVVVIPLISIIVALGFGLLIMGMIMPAWAFAFALCLKVFLNIMVGSIFLFDKMPFAHFYLSRKVSLWHVAVYYIVIFFGFMLLRLSVSLLPRPRKDPGINRFVSVRFSKVVKAFRGKSF